MLCTHCGWRDENAPGGTCPICGDGEMKRYERVSNDESVVKTDFLNELLAIVESEYDDMLGVDPDGEGEWTVRVREARDKLKELLGLGEDD